MKKHVLTMLLGLTITSAANAATVSFQDGFDGYNGTIDRPFLWNGDDSADSNTSGAIEFDMPTLDPPQLDPNPRYGYIEFTGVFGPGVNQVPVGPLTLVTSAVLTLEISNDFNNATLHRLLDDISNRPIGGGATAGDIGGPGRLDGPGVAGTFYDPNGVFSGDNPGTGPLDFDVTDIAQAWAAGATNYGFILLGGTDDGGAFRSSESAPNAQRPLLTIEFTQIPEPSTFAVLSVSAFGLVARRRRVA